jgi:hypothetical protein
MKTESLWFSGQHIKIAFFAIFCSLALFAFQPARAQLSLNLQLTPELQNAQILRVSDFNITGSGSVSRLFDLTITNNGAPTDVILRFQLTSDGFPGIIIVDATSQRFSVPTKARSLTYQDLTRDGRIDYDDKCLQELTGAILQTGRLSAGIYTFTITIEDTQRPNGQVSVNKQIVISNPTTLDLISPGAPVGGSECLVQFGPLPQFKWDSSADQFLITVCEALPTNSSPEDVMQNEPRLQRLVQRGTDFFGSPSFMYPSGGLPLEFGRTYYWQVHAVIASPSGEIRLPSEIWCFQISNLRNPGVDLLLQQLFNLLNSSEFATLFGDGGPLHGFRPTGEVMLNGRRIDLSQLLAFLRSQPVRTVSMQVE